MVLDTPERLLERIRLGEDSLLELKVMMFSGEKVKGPSRSDLADEVAALANAHGGVLVLGVDDRTKEVLGIPLDRLDTAERFAHEVCFDSIKPPVQARIERILLAGTDGTERPILRIDIPRSPFVHKSPGGYWHRVGSAKREMAPEYLVRLLQQRSQSGIVRMDEQLLPGTTLANLDAQLIEKFRGERSDDSQAVLLRKLAMAREDDGGVLRPTMAGILLACEAPERFLPHAYVQAVAYGGDGTPGTGDAEGYQMDARDITGPLDVQVEEACRFVIRNMRVSASKTVGRSERPQYDVSAVFEAVVNAVAHRDYSMYGSRIRLRMYATRFELLCPGTLVNTMTVDSLPFRQASRNEAITSLLAKCEVPGDLHGLETTRSTLMDRRGEGVSIILDRSERLSGRRPVYETPDGSELKLTIFAAGSAIE